MHESPSKLPRRKVGDAAHPRANPTAHYSIPFPACQFLNGKPPGREATLASSSVLLRSGRHLARSTYLAFCDTPQVAPFGPLPRRPGQFAHISLNPMRLLSIWRLPGKRHPSNWLVGFSRPGHMRENVAVIHSSDNKISAAGHPDSVSPVWEPKQQREQQSDRHP